MSFELDAKTIEVWVHKSIDFIGGFVKTLILFLVKPRRTAAGIFRSDNKHSPSLLPAVPYCVILAFGFLLIDAERGFEILSFQAAKRSSFLLRDVSLLKLVLSTIPMMIFIIPISHLLARWLKFPQQQRKQFADLILYSCGTQAVLLCAAVICDVFTVIYVYGIIHIGGPPSAWRRLTLMFVDIVVFGYVMIFPYLIWKAAQKSEGNSSNRPPWRRRAIALITLCCFASPGYFLVGHATVRIIRTVASDSDVSLRTRWDTGFINKGKFSAQVLLTVENETEKSVSFEKDDLVFRLTTNLTNREPFQLKIDEIATSSGETREVYSIPPKGATAFLAKVSLSTDTIGVNADNFEEFDYYGSGELWLRGSENGPGFLTSESVRIAVFPDSDWQVRALEHMRPLSKTKQ